jgi:predicted lipoprotein
MKMAGRIQTFLQFLGLLFCSCVPWTVVPLEDDNSRGLTGADRFEASAYVDSIWESRLLPYARESALPATSVRPGEGGGKAVFLSGEGRVIEAETRGRTGRLSIDLPSEDGKPNLVIVTGPVIFGTALRDAAGFIEFSQFRNQLEYADVANELNRRAAESVAASLDLETLLGRTVRFSGAWDGSGPVIEIVPVILEVQ